MEITVLNERANPLLQRREFHIDILHPSSASPKRGEVRKEFCAVKSAVADRMVVEWVRAVYGAPRSRGLIYVYDNVEALKKTARHHILLRNGLIKDAKDAKTPAPSETPAPEPAAAAPAAKKGA
jgi:small subunit ribosomal protein S24e